MAEPAPAVRADMLNRALRLATEEAWTREQVATFLVVSPATIDRWAREREDFPKPFALGGRCTRWSRIEVVEWMRSQPRRARGPGVGAALTSES